MSTTRSTRSATLPLPPPPPAAQPFLTTSELTLLITSTLFKLLLFQSYHSTDFEVHRNWLAITHELPLKEWYFDTTSPWTLDYPPFFAYFSKLLSLFAYLIDPSIVDLSNLNYSSWTCVIYMRSTVLVSELVLFFALIKWARRSQKPDSSTAFIIISSVMFHPGLMIVDHIHFQYNGFLLGILVWSLVEARDNNLLTTTILFASLLNFKHIFIYLAPPFLIFLFRSHCFSTPTPTSPTSLKPSFTKSKSTFLPDKFLELALLVLLVLLISFSPFLLSGGFSQLPQIISRLFPFQRGLNHAYWAAGVWSWVTVGDRLGVRYLLSKGLPIPPSAVTSSSRGLVTSTTFALFPEITPLTTFSLTLSFITIYMIKLWFSPSYEKFLEGVVLSGMTSFLWGWHVHEKAVLIFLIPLGLIAVEDDTHLRAYIIASCAGIYSLFPLLIQPAETPIKIIFSVLWCSLVFPSLRRVVYLPTPTLTSLLIDYAERAYVAGFLVLQLYVGVLHDLIFSPAQQHWYWTTGAQAILKNGTIAAASGGGGMEFLPLMLTSLYCSVGIIWAWVRLSLSYLS